MPAYGKHGRARHQPRCPRAVEWSSRALADLVKRWHASDKIGACSGHGALALAPRDK